MNYRTNDNMEKKIVRLLLNVKYNNKQIVKRLRRDTQSIVSCYGNKGLLQCFTPRQYIGYILQEFEVLNQDEL